MNNSVIEQYSLTEEVVVDIKPQLRKREQELTEIIESIHKVAASNYWKLLEQKVFGGIVTGLHNRLIAEKNPTEIYRLQGQIVWAEKYSDFTKLAQVYENELLNIRKKLDASN